MRNTQVTVGANVSLFGTKADLADLLNGGTLTVKFRGPGLNAEVPVSAVTNAPQPVASATAPSASAPTPLVNGPPARQAALEAVPELFVPVAAR